MTNEKLKAIAAEVEREFGMGGLSEGIYFDFTAEVARRAIKLPRHNASLTLEHNAHRDVYMTAEEWLKDQGEHDYVPAFRDASAKQRAIATDSIWLLHWYPDTPVGFIVIAAPTLEEVLAWAQEIDKELRSEA